MPTTTVKAFAATPLYPLSGIELRGLFLESPGIRSREASRDVTRYEKCAIIYLAETEEIIGWVEENLAQLE